MMKRTPFLPTWLLKHLGCSSDNHAVLGDLSERYQQGQTAAWYWKQTLVAIIVSAFDEVRGHKWLTFRYVLVGWIVFSYLLLPLTGVIFKSILDSYREFETASWNSAAVTASSYAIIGIFVSLTFVMGMITGWIAARLHGRQRAPILVLAITIPTSFVSGNPGGVDSFVFWIGVATLTVSILFGGLFVSTTPLGMVLTSITKSHD
jgi:hypothetical protein